MRLPKHNLEELQGTLHGNEAVGVRPGTRGILRAHHSGKDSIHVTGLELASRQHQIPGNFMNGTLI